MSRAFGQNSPQTTAKLLSIGAPVGAFKQGQATTGYAFSSPKTDALRVSSYECGYVSSHPGGQCRDVTSLSPKVEISQSRSPTVARLPATPEVQPFCPIMQGMSRVPCDVRTPFRHTVS